jgi:integrase
VESNELDFDDVKTARSRRTIDIDPVTVAALKAHRHRQRELRVLVGPGWTDNDLVFCAPDGRPWHPDSISTAFARMIARLDVPRIRLHDLRHTHATHLLAAGVNVKLVSERLGHASVAFTLDTYAHVLPGQQAEAAAAAAALVDG